MVSFAHRRTLHKKFSESNESATVRKRGLVTAPSDPGINELRPQHDHVMRKQPNDGTATTEDTSDVQFIDESGENGTIEITSGLEDEQRGSRPPHGDSDGEEQGRRQNIETLDLSYLNGSQAGGEESSDEVLKYRVNLPNTEVPHSDHGKVGLAGPDSPHLMDGKVLSDNHYSGGHIAVGSSGDSKLFYGASDRAVGTLLHPKSAFSARQQRDHYGRLGEPQSAYNSEGRRLSGGARHDSSYDDNTAGNLVEETATHKEKADEQDNYTKQTSLVGTVPRTVKRNFARTTMEDANGNKHQNETSSHTGEVATVDDEPSETEVEEIDEENKEKADEDISVLDQPKAPADSFNDSKELAQKNKQLDYEIAGSILNKTNGDNNEKTETDPAEQFIVGQETPQKQETFETQLLQGESDQALQMSQSHRADRASLLAKLLPNMRQHTNIRELKDTHAQGNDRFEPELRGANPSNKSVGLLMHQILLNYFKNESALRGNLHQLPATVGVPLADAGVEKNSSYGNVLVPANDSQLEYQEDTDNSDNPGYRTGLNTVAPNGETTSNPSEGIQAYMDPAPNEDAHPAASQATKKQELSDSDGEMILVLKNKTFGVLIGHHKNTTVRLLSKESPLAALATSNERGHSTEKPVPHREQVTSPISNDTAQSETNANIWTKITNEAKSQNASLSVTERQLSRPGIDAQNDQRVVLPDTVGPKDASLSSPESKVDGKTQTSASYLNDLKSLEVVLSRDFMKDWMYEQSTFEELGISPDMLRAGVVSMGVTTRLERVLRNGLNGADVNLLIVAGSMSAGAGLEVDQKNLGGVYYKALVNWWFRYITPITASKLKVDAVAIGGTDSEYYSYCIQNYIDQPPDLVIWELASNDYQRYLGRNFSPEKPLEQLTRVLLSWPSRPAVIFLNFFAKHNYRSTGDCPNAEDEAGDVVAKYYGIPSLSWRNVVCPEIGKNAATSLDHLFSSDGSHPSITGHAQMASLLITFIKSVFEKTITMERDRDMETGLPDNQVPALPPPLHENADFHSNAFCWTLLTPDYTSKLRNTLPGMDFVAADGFLFTNVSHWPIRLDRQRCLRAWKQGATLKMQFFAPPSQASRRSDSLDPSEAREVVVISHNSFRGSARVWLDENYEEAQVIAELPGKRRTQVDILNTPVLPGLHTLTVQAVDLGFCLSAVALS